MAKKAENENVLAGRLADAIPEYLSRSVLWPNWEMLVTDSKAPPARIEAALRLLGERGEWCTLGRLLCDYGSEIGGKRAAAQAAFKKAIEISSQHPFIRENLRGAGITGSALDMAREILRGETVRKPKEGMPLSRERKITRRC